MSGTRHRLIRATSRGKNFLPRLYLVKRSDRSGSSSQITLLTHRVAHLRSVMSVKNALKRRNELQEDEAFSRRLAAWKPSLELGGWGRLLWTAPRSVTRKERKCDIFNQKQMFCENFQPKIVHQAIRMRTTSHGLSALTSESLKKC